MKSDRLTDRKSQLTTAYLGHRLTRAQLNQMVVNLEADETLWNDKFESFTTRGNTQAPAEQDGVFESNLEELGLTQRFEELDDDQVWSAEDRALYRKLSHPDYERLSKEPSDRELNDSPVTVSARKYFVDWDRDNDNLLQFSEIDFVMSGGFYGQTLVQANDPEKASTLAALARHGPYIASAYPHDGAGVSQRDLLLVEEAPTDILSEMRSTLNTSFDEYSSWAKSSTVSDLQGETVSGSSIHQGVAGSCVLLSTLACLSEVELRSFFVETDDQTVRVRFKDGHEEVVAEPTLAERMYHAKGADKERWPALLEMAMAQRLYSEEAPEDGALRSAIDGIAPEKALKALTGKETDKRNLDELTVRQSEAALGDLLSRGGPVICGSRPAPLRDFISIEELNNGIHPGHAYSVLGFSEENQMVTLRNPWGHGEWVFQESPDDGIFEMPLRQFYANFRWVAGVQAD